MAAWRAEKDVTSYVVLVSSIAQLGSVFAALSLLSGNDWSWLAVGFDVTPFG